LKSVAPPYPEQILFGDSQIFFFVHQAGNVFSKSYHQIVYNYISCEKFS